MPVASFTVTKLRWLAEHEPANAARTAAVCLPHDWLSWRLAGVDRSAWTQLVTDRSDASGTGYFDGRTQRLPARPAGPGAGPRRGAAPGRRPGRGRPIEAGRPADRPGRRRQRGRRARRAGRRRRAGVAGHVRGGLCPQRAASRPTRAGLVAGFADATGAFLPLVCTLNAARVLDAAARLLGVGLAELSELALSAEPGAGGLTLVPYLEGERTPNLPQRDRRGARADAGQRDRRPTWPGPRSRACCAGWPAGLDALVGTGGFGDRRAADRRRGPVRGGAPDRADRVRGAGRRCPRPASTWPTARPGRRPGCWPAPPSRRPGRSARRRASRRAPTAGLRERYAEAAGKYLNR